MKHSVLRLSSACLLLGICVALLLGVIAAVSKPQQAAWTSVQFFARGAQTLRIYDAQGKPLEQVQTDEAGEGRKKPPFTCFCERRRIEGAS